MKSERRSKMKAFVTLKAFLCLVCKNVLFFLHSWWSKADYISTRHPSSVSSTSDAVITAVSFSAEGHFLGFAATYYLHLLFFHAVPNIKLPQTCARSGQGQVQLHTGMPQLLILPVITVDSVPL